jgi:hypothetical protein
MANRVSFLAEITKDLPSHTNKGVYCNGVIIREQHTDSGIYLPTSGIKFVNTQSHLTSPYSNPATPSGVSDLYTRSQACFQKHGADPGFPCYTATMCGRFASFLPAEALRQIFGTVNPLPNIAPSWNLAPTQPAPLVRLHPETKQRHLNVLIWGLVPYFTDDLRSARRPINARAETVATSGMFKAAFARRGVCRRVL